jgi:hypothetical protein
MSKNNIWQNIIASTRETLESSSIHAIPNISRNKYYTIKLTWTIFFLVSVSFCGYSIYSSISDYLNYNVITNIKIKQTNKIKFPVVTICNLNFYATNLSFIASKTLFNTTRPNLNLITLAQTWTSSLTDLFGIDKKALGHSVHDTLVSCKFNQLDCVINEDFEYFYDVIYGNCFRFNSGKNMLGNLVEQVKYNTQVGKKNGLELDLFVGSAEDNDYPFSQENGYIVFISNEALNLGSGDGIKISAGVSTSIKVDKYSIIKMPKPFSECTSDLVTKNAYESELYKKMIDSSVSLNLKYRYSDCYFLCFQKYVGKICECQLSIFNYVYFKNMKMCFLPDSNNKQSLD